MEDAYFFDTYALVEIIKGNPRYARFKHSKVVLTVFNLFELHYKLLRDFDKKIADKVLAEYSSSLVSVDIESIKDASEFKLIYRRKNMSATDVIGFVSARRYGLKFLTGDRQFRNLHGVEFVK